MWENEILEEIHKYREEYARSFNYDLNAIVNDLRKKQLAHGTRVVKLPIKRRPINRITQELNVKQTTEANQL